MAAALQLFAEEGVNATTVARIVAAARTSKTAFYEHWSSKEDCLRQLLEVQGGSLIDRVVTAAAGGKGQRERMRLGIAEFVRSCAAQRQLANLVLVESVGASREVEATRALIMERFAAMVEAEVTHGQEPDPFYSRLDPAVLGRAVVGAVNEATRHFLRHPDSDPDSLIRGLWAVFAPSMHPEERLPAENIAIESPR